MGEQPAAGPPPEQRSAADHGAALVRTTTDQADAQSRSTDVGPARPRPTDPSSPDPGTRHPRPSSAHALGHPAAPPVPPEPEDGAEAPRRALDQLSILHEAVSFIDEHGVQNLTMRRLGSRLGVEAMALYRYIPGREQLLDGVVEVVMDELYSDTMRPADQSRSWTEYLQRMAHGVRTLALTHPQVFPLVATRPPAAPWLRPPLRSLRWVEGFMEGLVHHGFNGRTSVSVYRAFSTFLLGHLLLETSTLGGEMGLSEEEDTEFIESNNLDNYPMVTRFSTALSANAYQDEFEEALEDLLDRLAPLHRA